MANEAATKWQRTKKIREKYEKKVFLSQKFITKTETEEAEYACLPFVST